MTSAMDQNIVWAPQPGSQPIFLQCPLYEVMYHGNRGPGKTDCLLMDFAQFVGKGFGAAWRGILFRKSYKQLADVVTKSKKWFKKIFPDAKFLGSMTDFKWVFASGEELLFRTFKTTDDYWDYHGHEYPWIGWEELTSWPTDEGYKMMMSCCRSSTPGIPRHYRATTNPYGPGHNWVKDRFQLPARNGRVIDDSFDDEGRREPPRVAIQGFLHENKILLDADPGYVRRISAAARNDAERRAWLLGDWDVVAGGMFDDVWDKKIHFIKPFTPPKSWYFDRSFDWGSAAPFSVGWWAESDGSDYINHLGHSVPTVPGDLFRLGEWYGWNGKPNKGVYMTADVVAAGIVEREEDWFEGIDFVAGPADSAIFPSDMAPDKGVSGLMEDEGVYWQRADKSRKNGWEAFRAYLANAKMIKDEDTGILLPREKPGMFVFDTCLQFLRTVPVLPRSEGDPDDVDTDAEDHIGDEVRYRCRSEKMQTTTKRLRGR